MIPKDYLSQKTPDEARAFLKKVLGPNKRQLVGKELENTLFLIDMCTPMRVSNNQCTMTEEYLIAGRRYDITYFSGEDDPIVEVYEDESNV